MNGRVGLVAFDLDGTLLRGDTVCLALATRLGRRERMLELERCAARVDLVAAREEMAGWYRTAPTGDLIAALEDLALAPGARDAFHLLKKHRILTAIVSLTWDFAVAWIARTLGADYFVGTWYQPDGSIEHFWPEDKPRWLGQLANDLELPLDQVAAIGDSAGDLPMLRATGQSFFVGETRPQGISHLVHQPDGNLLTIAHSLVDRSTILGLADDGKTNLPIPVDARRENRPGGSSAR